MSQLIGGASVKGRISPLLIVLIVIGGLLVLGVAAVVGVGWFVMTKVEQAGLGPDSWEENPGVAVTKLIAAFNSDIEIVHIDEERKRVTVRNTETDKTVTVDFDRLREGDVIFQEEGGEQVEVSASAAGVTVEGEGKSYQIGAAAADNLPIWLDECPGCEVTGVMSNQTNEGSGGMASFTSADSVESVIDFFDEALKDADMEVNTVRHASAAGGGGMVQGEDKSRGRTAVVIVGKGNDGQTSGSITYSEK